MITRITGKLVSLNGVEASIDIGAFEYEVAVPDFVRRQLQSQIGKEITLRTIEYLDGNPQKGRLVPRIIGFLSDVEKDFFDMICSVDGIGVKKALNAMVKPVSEVAVAIEEQDVKTLSALPGIGPAMAERIVAKLRRKMAKFALLIAREFPSSSEPASSVVSDALEALIALGHSPSDAREQIEKVMKTKGKFKAVDEILLEVYNQKRDK
jgi:holliday junction DNA helicase RuvA